MTKHTVKVCPSKTPLPRKEQLAWKLAECALDSAPISEKVKDMVINRMIDNAAVAVASLHREPVVHARDQALAHPTQKGAKVFGLSNQYSASAEWAAWANGVAVRELDFHDTFLAADYSHPADSIPPLLAVAQQMGKNGKDLLKGIVAAYEIHINLVKGICLHKHKIDHIAHLCPAQAAGIGSLLNMKTERVYQAIGQAVHLSFTTRQSRKGDISSWKAYAPAFSGKMAIESVDRALRGENSPSPIYEGEDSVIAWMLDGSEAVYEVSLVDIGEEKRSLLESYTKAHSAEYQSQAFIDLAFDLRKKIKDFSEIKEILIHTSHHTHYVIGTGAGDPQKRDPSASRETLDHSLMYIFAVALEDGKWHHEKSYLRERATRPETVKLWHKIRTTEEKKWTEAYHNESKRAFGGSVEIFMKDGSVIQQEKKMADAHPLGAKPYTRKDYIEKFHTLTKNIISPKESKRFLELVQKLDQLSHEEVGQLNVQANLPLKSQSQGIF